MVGTAGTHQSVGRVPLGAPGGHGGSTLFLLQDCALASKLRLYTLCAWRLGAPTNASVWAAAALNSRTTHHLRDDETWIDSHDV